MVVERELSSKRGVLPPPPPPLSLPLLAATTAPTRVLAIFPSSDCATVFATEAMEGDTEESELERVVKSRPKAVFAALRTP